MIVSLFSAYAFAYFNKFPEGLGRNSTWLSIFFHCEEFSFPLSEFNRHTHRVFVFCHPRFPFRFDSVCILGMDEWQVTSLGCMNMLDAKEIRALQYPFSLLLLRFGDSNCCMRVTNF